GEPVPAGHALAADDQAVAEGLDGAEERLRGGRQVAGEASLAVLVEDAEEQGPGVEIDAGIESGAGGGLEVAHEGLRLGGMRGGGGWGPPPSSQARAFMSIQRLKLTGAAILVFRAS